MSAIELAPSDRATLASRGHRVLKKLGEGSYAQVFLVEHDDDEHHIQLACKLFDASKATRDYVRKFLPRELDVLVKIEHPHIIEIHSIFQHRHKYFILMRYAERGDLLDFVLGHGELRESRARFWCRQVALAIKYLHTMGISHRDLKCENLLITEKMNIKVADFGFSRPILDEFGRSVLSETYCGSISYAAPEILRGKAYDPRISDVWAIGVTLYVMLNKAMPFDDSNIKRMRESQMNKVMKFKSKVVDKLSINAKNTTFALLEPDPKKRMTLDQLLDGEWFAMDSRLSTLSDQERYAFQRAKQVMKELSEKSAKQKGRANVPSVDSKTAMTRVQNEKIQIAFNNDAASSSLLTVIKGNSASSEELAVRSNESMADEDQ